MRCVCVCVCVCALCGGWAGVELQFSEKKKKVRHIFV